MDEIDIKPSVTPEALPVSLCHCAPVFNPLRLCTLSAFAFNLPVTPVSLAL